MNFLFVHQNFPGQYLHLANELVARGHQVTALTIHQPRAIAKGIQIVSHRPPTLDRKTYGSISPYQLDVMQKLMNGGSGHQALLALKQQGYRPDLVCAHPGWGDAMHVKDVFPDAPVLSYCEFYYRAQALDMNFDPEFSRLRADDHARVRLKNTHLLHGLAAADAGISPTRFQKDTHPEWAKNLIHVIHDGINTEHHAPDPAATVSLRRASKMLACGQEVVTFVARHLEPYRGYHTFMRALPYLLELRPNAQVVIVGGNGVSYGAPPSRGTTWKDTFYNAVKDRLDAERVHFVGTVPHRVLNQLFQVSAAHVYLTYPFVLSWSMLEAMSAGALVIGSRTAPVEEVIRHGENGLLVDFFDSEGLARTIADALARPEEMKILKQAARRTIQERYDLRTVCLPAQLDLIESLTGQSTKSKE